MFAATLCLGAHAAETVPTSDFHTIDLSRHYNRSTNDFAAGTAWSAVPWGSQTFGGIPFELTGILELTGMGAAQDGFVFPGRYEGIKVRRKAEWIHLLHGTGYDESDGTAIARITLNYENGEKRSLDIEYGVHVRNWWVMKSEKVAAVTDPNSQLAWTGTSPQTDPSGVTLRLFQTSLQNPLPDQLIQSVDFSSLFRRATPVIVAMTVGRAGQAKPVAAASSQNFAFAEAGLRAESLLRLEDAASGKFIPNARVRLSVEGEKGSYFFGEQSADANGITRVQYPLTLFTRISFAVKAPGYATHFHNMSLSDLKKEWVLKLTRGIAVGGLVKDPAGKPIAGATVAVSAVARDEVGQSVLSEYDSVQTDAAGKWASSALPADFKSLSLEVAHPRFLPGEFEQAQSDNPQEKTFSKESLLAGKAVLILEPGISVEGGVADTAGKPVSDAEVALADFSDPPKKQITRTDSKGGFSFVSTNIGEFQLVAQAKGYAPTHKPLNVERGLKATSLTLTQANPLKGRVVDNSGKPVEGASVALQSWNELQLLNWRTKTDADGRFSWDSPPDGPAIFAVSKPGHYTINFMPNAGVEQTVTLMQTCRLSGMVVDAETKEPVKQFSLIPGHSWSEGADYFRWERNEATSGKDGTYSVTLPFMRGARVKFMVRADGYLPAATDPLPESGVHTFDFELKRGTGLSGVVQLPSGEPVAAVTVYLTDQTEGVYMDKQGEFRQEMFQTERVVTDAQGRFQFLPKLDAYSVLVAHEKGYAEVPADQVASRGKVVLQPWGRVQGTVKVGGKPAPNQTISLYNMNYRYGYGGRQFPALGLYLEVRPDPDGHFVFEKVPPGERKIWLRYRFHDDPGETPTSHGKFITVRPGETTEVSLGGTGRPVIGRVKATGADASQINWNHGVSKLTTKFPDDPEKDSPYQKQFASPEERRKAAEEYSKKHRAFWMSEAGHARDREMTSYVLVFDQDGSFRADNVPAGTYTLNISLTEPGQENFPHKAIGGLTREVVVPEVDGFQPEAPFDLGTLELVIKQPPRAAQQTH